MTLSKFAQVLTVLLLASEGQSASVRGLQQNDNINLDIESIDSMDDGFSTTATCSLARTSTTCVNKRQCISEGIGTTKPCVSLVNNPKQSLRRTDQCKCTVVAGFGKWTNVGTIPSGGGGGGGVEDGEVDVKFFGNIVGHAKMLCQIIESIDCWQKGKSQSQSDANGNFPVITLNMPDGQQKTAALGDIIGTVKTICKVVDGGIGELPNLFPGLGGGGGGGSLPGGDLPFLGGNPPPGGGFPNLLSDLLKGLLGRGGGGGGGLPGFGGGGGGGGGFFGGIIGGILDGFLGGIFVADGNGVLVLSDAGQQALQVNGIAAANMEE